MEGLYQYIEPAPLNLLAPAAAINRRDFPPAVSRPFFPLPARPARQGEGAVYDQLIEVWARALERRDRESRGHARRVTHLALALARRAGVPGSQLADIRRGALLHDLGKLAVPASILFKPGPLSEAEWQVMRRHPVTAFELLAPLDFFRNCLAIPYSHHEHWDGSGYPRRLAGAHIPLAARLFTIVDVWDALTNARSYHAAWPEEAVKKYIRQQSGRLFDPRVVEAFLEMMGGKQTI